MFLNSGAYADTAPLAKLAQGESGVPAFLVRTAWVQFLPPPARSVLRAFHQAVCLPLWDFNTANCLLPVCLHTLMDTIVPRKSVERIGHIQLHSALVIGHRELPGVQRVLCHPFLWKQFHGGHRQDLVFMRPWRSAWRLGLSFEH